jgi:DNA (cytosine-5)-methyltransferase 1
VTALAVVSLHSGIGGLDLGLERAGMTVLAQVEINPFCQQVLARHWPEALRHDDVRTAADWWQSQPRPHVDVVATGFPCQPVSAAGLRLGTDDPRWLWPANAAFIAAVRPRWVVWENVPGLLTRGLEHVHGDLVRLGYRHRVGWASACAVGAPHMRRRLFGLAHTTGLGRDRSRGGGPGPASLEDRRRRPQPGRRWSDQPRPHGVAYGVPAGMDRRRAIGNAVVVDVAELIGRLITTADRDEKRRCATEHLETR